MAESLAAMVGTALVISAAPPPGASAEGVEQGQHHRRVSIDNAYWQRKQYFSIDIFFLLPRLLPGSMELCPPCPPNTSHYF